MKNFLMLAVTALVTFSFSDVANCQHGQYTQRQMDVRTASLPPGSMANMRTRDWRPRFSRANPPSQSVAHSFNDGSQWNAPAAPQQSSYPNTVLQNVGPATDYYPEMNRRSVVTPTPTPYQDSVMHQDSGGNGGSFASSGSWNTGGYSPYLTGNIFGVGSDECCDEWANHCPCLELTNDRSNCGCTNRYRTKDQPCRDGYRTNQTDCQGCNRSASRSTVSEYFHPDEYRR